MMQKEAFHRPVLGRMAVAFLLTRPDGVYVDCTTGGGGHSEIVLQSLDPAGTLLGIDADPDAIAAAGERLQAFPNKRLRIANFNQLDVLLLRENLIPVDGFLFDLGISSFQVDTGDKGFSFQKDGRLDMRFHPDQQVSAREVVNEYSCRQLETIFRQWGEEKNWRAIARQIVNKREQQKLETTGQLAEIIQSVIPARFANKTLARIFQAIRIEVNQEMDRLKSALEMAFSALAIPGRIVVISYHSLEDRIVKEFFRFKQSDCICPPDFPQCACDKQSEMRILTRKPLRPDAVEIEMNPRSRSARLRAAEKIIPLKGKI